MSRTQTSPPIDENSISPSKAESGKTRRNENLSHFFRFMSIFHFPVRLNSNHNIQQVSSLLAGYLFCQRNFEPEPRSSFSPPPASDVKQRFLSFVPSTTLNGCEQRERSGRSEWKIGLNLMSFINIQRANFLLFNFKWRRKIADAVLRRTESKYLAMTLRARWGRRRRLDEVRSCWIACKEIVDVRKLPKQRKPLVELKQTVMCWVIPARGLGAIHYLAANLIIASTIGLAFA